MRTYFLVLFGLLLVAIFVSYKIATTLAFNKLDEQVRPHSGYALADNGTSNCFEKRYSPQIRDCGGLLQYSTPTVAYHDEKSKHPRAAKRKHPTGHALASHRLPKILPKTGVLIGKTQPPMGPSHSEVASFER
jgi:hypothetical protein